MTKRYLVFAGDNYYPMGGAEDFQGQTDDLDWAHTLIMRYRPDSSGSWAHVVDTDTDGFTIIEAWRHGGRIQAQWKQQ